MPNYKLEEVFGTSRKIPSSYTERDIDRIFLESLQRGKHIVIYGSSKQGKTCLRKKNLQDHKYITIVCDGKQDITHLHSKILREAGVEDIVIHSRTEKGNLAAELEGGFNLGFNARAKGSLEGSVERSKDTKPMNIDLADVNDIIKELQRADFEKIILLEDFHYLKPETQKDFSNALKAYYDNSNIKFIIVGVWLDTNKLVTFNGDLAHRIESINVDSWNRDYLKALIEEGCRLLNIKFDDNLIDEIIDRSFDNVSFVQEICYKICSQYKITKTLPDEPTPAMKSGYYDSNENLIEAEEAPDNRFLIKIVSDFDGIVKKIVEQHSGRYNAFLSLFTKTAEWIVYCLFQASDADLQDGLNVNYIINLLRDTNQTNTEQEIIETLKSVTQSQYKNDIRPAIIDFDHGVQKLNIVDKEFIVWRSYQNMSVLLSSLHIVGNKFN